MTPKEKLPFNEKKPQAEPDSWRGGHLPWPVGVREGRDDKRLEIKCNLLWNLCKWRLDHLKNNMSCLYSSRQRLFSLLEEYNNLKAVFQEKKGKTDIQKDNVASNTLVLLCLLNSFIRKLQVNTKRHSGGTSRHLVAIFIRVQAQVSTFRLLFWSIL